MFDFFRFFYSSNTFLLNIDKIFDDNFVLDFSCDPTTISFDYHLFDFLDDI